MVGFYSTCYDFFFNLVILQCSSDRLLKAAAGVNETNGAKEQETQRKLNGLRSLCRGAFRFRCSVLKFYIKLKKKCKITMLYVYVIFLTFYT